MKVGITGADGFIGSRLCDYIETQGHASIRCVRAGAGAGSDRRVIGSDFDVHRMSVALSGVEAVVHLAARAHILKETEVDPEGAYHRDNVILTRTLAKAAVLAGVKRFVFVSSIGVNGSKTYQVPFSEPDPPVPTELYAQSKLVAENVLWDISSKTGLEVVIIRPPLVYGPGAGGNFQRLIRLSASGWPLPIEGVVNRRSLIGVTNLCDFISLCVTHARAANQLFLIAEPVSYSTAEIVTAVRCALGMPKRMFYIAPFFLGLIVRMLGKGPEFDKFCGSLEISSSKARTLLGWCPRVTFEEEVFRSAQAIIR